MAGGKGFKRFMSHIYSIYFKTLQLCDTRFCRNSSLKAVRDTPIACVTECVSSLRI